MNLTLLPYEARHSPLPNPCDGEETAQGTVEERLDRLEELVDKVLNRLSSANPRQKNWRRTIGMFDDDPIMKGVIDDALRSRANERPQFYKDFDKQHGES